MRLTLAALSRPITLVVAMLALVATAVLAVRRMPVDIFPVVGDPAVYVAQPYGGMDPAQMDGFLTYYYEYHFLYIAGIEHIESKSIQGVALLKLVFHPGTDMNQAMSQVVGYVNRARAFMPTGAVPPFITRFDAGSVPIGQLVFSSQTRLPAEMQDIALNRVRPLFATLPGVSAPPPFGGNQRTIVVRLDPERLRSYRVSPEEAIAAVSRATVVTPSGNVRTGDLNRITTSNATLGGNLSELLESPVRVGAGPSVYLRDLGVVENGTDIVTSYAHVNGRRTVYIPVTKRADASTVAVIAAVRANLPAMRALAPEDVDIRLEFDQSQYVISAILNLVTEGVLGALLTGLMVLLFLRDWRSALIVVATIPGALMAAVVGLWSAGQTLNLMTLGGLALAVGVLVDEATVAIESVHSRLDAGASRIEAVVEASRTTAVPRLLAMLTVLAVFLPSFFLVGVPRQLFVPLAIAVAFAMIASYVLSSTLVPVLAAWWMPAHSRATGESVFDRLQAGYESGLRRLLERRVVMVLVYLAACAGVIALVVPALGLELFPVTGSDQLLMRLRAATGTRIERTEPLTLRVLDEVKREVGEANIQISTAFIGVQPASYPINTIYLWTSGPHEAVLLVSLSPEAARDGGALRERLRARLAKAVPEMTVTFEAGDIVSQVMSFGSPTPVEVAVQGLNLQQNREHADKILKALAALPFLRDLQVAQPLDYPTLAVTIDRERAGQYGLTMSNVARSLVTATASSRFVEPNYWRDPVSGNGFQIQVEIPQNRVASADDLRSLTVTSGSSTTLGDVASVSTGTMPGMIERYNGQRVVSLTANLSGTTLGQALPDIRGAIAAAGEATRGVTVAVRGQVPVLEQTIAGLQSGLALSVLAIVLLLSAYFQSFRLTLAVIAAVPAALSGVALMLWLTGTSLNVQSFVGATMAVGIGVANAILLVSFAETARRGGASSLEAAALGSAGRLRAVMMTASAMMVGMVPMALGLGDGGAQAAPLGRAVIGGLALATVATLLVVPACYAWLQAGATTSSPSLNPLDARDEHVAS